MVCCLDTHPIFDDDDKLCHPLDYQQTGNASVVAPFNYDPLLAQAADLSDSVDVDQSVGAEATTPDAGRRLAQQWWPSVFVHRVGRMLQGDASPPPAASPPPISAAGQIFPLGCRAGTSTGTSADSSRCKVVRIDLPGNGITGPIASNASGDAGFHPLDEPCTSCTNVFCELVDLQVRHIVVPHSYLDFLP